MKKKPVYTFRRSRKKTPPPPPQETYIGDMYSNVDDSELSIDQIARYTRYSFFVLFLMLVLFILAGLYIHRQGLPVKIRM